MPIPFNRKKFSSLIFVSTNSLAFYCSLSYSQSHFKSFYNVKTYISILLRKYPVLLQGETSVGKTSLITYLAKSTGNQCVRINNHEHTDIQEYIGCYSADENGKLVFKDGEKYILFRKETHA